MISSVRTHPYNLTRKRSTHTCYSTALGRRPQALRFLTIFVVARVCRRARSVRCHSVAPRAKNGKKKHGGNHDNDRKSVFLCFVACSRKCAFLLTSFRLVSVSARRTQSTHKTVTRGPWLLQKRCIWHFGCDGRLQSGSSPLSKEVARAKQVTTCKALALPVYLDPGSAKHILEKAHHQLSAHKSRDPNEST